MCSLLATGEQLYSVNEWERGGRGRELQFFATDEEVAHFLSQLPREFGPYSLLRANGSVCCDRFTVMSPGELTAILAGGAGSFWLVSHGLFPSFSVPATENINAFLSINGLVLLQHGAMRKGKREASRIAIVSTIYSPNTGRKVQHKTRQRIFDALKGIIEPQLVYKSVHRFVDGHDEESTLDRMTEPAAALARTGFFSRMPGSKINP